MRGCDNVSAFVPKHRELCDPTVAGSIAVANDTIQIVKIEPKNMNKCIDKSPSLMYKPIKSKLKADFNAY